MRHDGRDTRVTAGPSRRSWRWPYPRSCSRFCSARVHSVRHPARWRFKMPRPIAARLLGRGRRAGCGGARGARGGLGSRGVLLALRRPRVASPASVDASIGSLIRMPLRATSLRARRGPLMAGSALASGVLAVAAALSLGLAAVGGAAVTAQRTAGAADAAALADSRRRRAAPCPRGSSRVNSPRGSRRAGGCHPHGVRSRGLRGDRGGAGGVRWTRSRLPSPCGPPEG